MGAAENRAEDQSHLQSLTYFRINKDLAEHHPNLLQSQVNPEHRKLVLERILPIIQKLYEEILWNMVDESDEPGYAINVTNEAVLASIENFLLKKQRSNLVMFETKTWEDVNNYESYRTEPTEAMHDNIEQTIDNFNYKSNSLDTVSHKLRKHR